MLKESLPSLLEYYAALRGPWAWAAAALAASLLLTTLLACGDAVLHVRRRAPRRVRTPTTLVLLVYPLAGAASLCGLAFPRGQLAAEAAVQVVFACCFYQLFRLLLVYRGGGGGAASSETLDLAVGPCCCWPCCARLLPPPTAPTGATLRRLRLLVLQLPLVQTLLCATPPLLGDDGRLVNYLQPAALASILLAVWAVSAALRLVAPDDHLLRARAKFAALQSVLLLSKLQALVARGVVHLDLLPTAPPPFSAALCANLGYDGAMLLEMAALGLWARKLYRRPLTPPPPPTGPVSVCVVDSHFYGKGGAAPVTTTHRQG